MGLPLSLYYILFLTNKKFSTMSESCKWYTALGFTIIAVCCLLACYIIGWIHADQKLDFWEGKGDKVAEFQPAIISLTSVAGVTALCGIITRSTIADDDPCM